MEQISKKELLALTNISYGQLYRWKRERLIPEEWFIKQSSFTGQETFFPREQILERVQSIIELKDHYSLEELAQLLSPEASSTLSVDSLSKIDGVDGVFIDLLKRGYLAQKTELRFSEAVLLVALAHYIDTEGFTAEAAAELAAKDIDAAYAHPTEKTQCALFSVTGEGGRTYHVVFTDSLNAPKFDNDISLIGMLPLTETSDHIKKIVLKQRASDGGRS